MKTIIISFFLLFILVLIWLQFFYSPSNKQRIAFQINAKENVVRRSLQEQDKWQKWWPLNEERFLYHNQNFNQYGALINKVNIGIHYGDTLINSSIIIYSKKADTSVVEWLVAFPTPSGIAQKIKLYFTKRDLHDKMLRHSALLKQFAEKEENIYGMKIREENVVDPHLVSIKVKMTSYPSTDTIYRMIDQLRNYIKQQGAVENNSPMLHVEKTGDSFYVVMVALATNKPLTGTNIILPKKMVLGRILVAEIKGGQFTVDKQLKELENYVQDNNRNSPAIPYASLVTDRRKESDTTKWVTNIYYPVY